MAFVFVIIGAVLIWTAGRADWIVAYATGVAQLGVWLTLAGLVPVSALWQSLKRQPFVDVPTHQARAHWSVAVKVSMCGNVWQSHTVMTLTRHQSHTVMTRQRHHCFSLNLVLDFCETGKALF